MAWTYFTAPEEFIEELVKDEADIDRGIVRVCSTYSADPKIPTMRHVSLVASYTISGHLVKLKRYCGALWNLPDQDDKVRAIVDEHRAAVLAAIESKGLELRAGVYAESEDL